MTWKLARTIAASAAFAVAAGMVVSPASAEDLKVGISGTFTGPNATNGIPYRNAAEIFPDTLGGLPVQWIVLDDATDPTTAVKNARKFVDEDDVDIILGSTSSVTTAAMIDVADEAETPLIALAPIRIPEDKSAWVFNLAQPVPIMVSAIVEDMKKKGLKTVAFLGFADGWGDLNWNALQEVAADEGIEVIAGERFNRTDTSVTAQALKVMAAGPDAVFVGGAGTAAALPHVTLRDQGFEGPIYHTHGTVTKKFIEAAGPSAQGALMPTGPMVAAEGLPDDNPIKAVSLDFISKYEGKWGEGSANPLAGYAWDAMLLVDAAAEKASQSAEPGTQEFRTALRDALQSGTEVAGTNAVYAFTPDDHYGVDERSRVLVVVDGDGFRLAE